MLQAEASTGGVPWKKVFLKISQNSQENICARVSLLIKVMTWSLQFYLKRDSGTRVFLWILWNFQEYIFREYLHATASLQVLQ